MRGRERLAERQVVAGVVASDIRIAAVCLQLLAGVLTDRLQHPIPLAGAAEEALVDQRLQEIEISAGDLFGGLERAAVREDRESPQQALLGVGKQLVGPFDRRPQRLLARVRVTAAAQKVEPLGNPLEDLPWGQDGRASRGEL